MMKKITYFNVSEKPFGLYGHFKRYWLLPSSTSLKYEIQSLNLSKSKKFFVSGCQYYTGYGPAHEISVIIANAYNIVSKGAKMRNQYNQVSHLTQDTNGKVTTSQ